MTTLFSAYLHVPCMKQACDHIYLRYIYSVFINFLVALQMVFNDFILFIDLSYLLLIEYWYWFCFDILDMFLKWNKKYFSDEKFKVCLMQGCALL